MTEKDSEKIIRFIETYCLVPDGVHVGEQIKVADFQRKFIRDVYDNPHGTRRAYLSIARKNGKSGLIACLLLAHLVGPMAKLNTQIVSGARSRDQAALVFELARKMVMMNSKLKQVVRIVPSGKRLIGLNLNVEYKALSAEGKTAYGLSPVLAILDELGQVTGPRDDFVNAITTSQGAHQDPLLIAISTQAPTDADLFSVWLDDAEISKDKKIISHVYKASEDAEVLDEGAWEAANPAMGLFRSYEDLKQQAEQAQRMPSEENDFRNYCLNQRVTKHSPIVPRSVWQQNTEQPLPVDNNSPVYAGLDLSEKEDLTAFVLIFLKQDKWNVKPYFWTPEQTLMDRARRDRVPYDRWVKDGCLIATPGASVDYSFVAYHIAEITSGLNLRAIAFDRWKMEYLKKEFERIGFDPPLIKFGQGYKDMSPAIDVLVEDLLNCKFRHGDHPVLTMCAANTISVRDPAGNRKMDKAKSVGRIDGMVSLAMARGVIAHVEEEQTSVYEQRGMITI